MREKKEIGKKHKEEKKTRNRPFDLPIAFQLHNVANRVAVGGTAGMGQKNTRGR